MKIPVTPSGIDPATFQFVTQCLNHYTTNVTANKTSHICFVSQEIK
jgi:response regulator of citrate/malate metabolism